VLVHERVGLLRVRVAGEEWKRKWGLLLVLL